MWWLGFKVWKPVSWDLVAFAVLLAGLRLTMTKGGFTFRQNVKGVCVVFDSLTLQVCRNSDITCNTEDLALKESHLSYSKFIIFHVQRIFMSFQPVLGSCWQNTWLQTPKHLNIVFHLFKNCNIKENSIKRLLQYYNSRLGHHVISALEFGAESHRFKTCWGQWQENSLCPTTQMVTKMIPFQLLRSERLEVVLLSRPTWCQGVSHLYLNNFLFPTL